ARPVEPVDHHDVERIALGPIRVRDVEYLLLTRVARLRLNETERRFGRQRCPPRELCISGIQGVSIVTDDDEERHALTDFGFPQCAPIDTRIDVGIGGVIPYDSITAARDHERYADCLAVRLVVEVPAVDRAAA